MKSTRITNVKVSLSALPEGFFYCAPLSKLRFLSAPRAESPINSVPIKQDLWE